MELRTRTLAALVVGRHFQAQYVWGIQGVLGGERDVPRSTIYAIRDNHSEGIPPEHLQIIDFTRQLVRANRVDEVVEMRWVARDELDFAAMPADDAHWYERVLDGELLHGSFVFGAPNALRGKHVRALSALLDDDDGASPPYTRVKLPGGHPILDEVRYTD